MTAAALASLNTDPMAAKSVAAYSKACGAILTYDIADPPGVYQRRCCATDVHCCGWLSDLDLGDRAVLVSQRRRASAETPPPSANRAIGDIKRLKLSVNKQFQYFTVSSVVSLMAAEIMWWS
ncbi:hypothetical protein [Mycobacterium attenuatum]|uniref:hypothetical protein n=1 Tax=Mycobacterium attenuatum TaxID=2341086 RepID=UPI00145A019C|nr:hypothetical protein [Mycobacterium attenuatum]